MKLYYEIGACSLAVRIVIHELGLPCEYERVDLKKKLTESGTDFFLLNSKGSVPALQDNDGAFLTESTVIQQYLAEKHNATYLLPDINNFNRYRVLEWMNFITTDLHKGCCSILFNSAIDEKIKTDIFKPTLQKKLSLINDHLKDNVYLALDTFNLSDANLFVILNWLPDLNIDFSGYKSLAQYFTRLNQRPSIINSLWEEMIE